MDNLNMSSKGRKKRHKPTGYTKRTLEQKERDINFCTDLFLKGYGYRKISEMLNVKLAEWGCDYTISYGTVMADLQRVMAEWKRESISRIDKYLSIELKKLDLIEQEAWRGWERSQKYNSNKPGRPPSIIDLNEDGTISNRQEVEFEGNARFLDIIIKVQRRRAALLGLDAPKRILLPQDTKPDTKDDTVGYDLSLLPDDIITTIADTYQLAQHNKLVSDSNVKSVVIDEISDSYDIENDEEDEEED